MKVVSYFIGSFLTQEYIHHYIDYKVIKRIEQNQSNTLRSHKNTSNEITNRKHGTDRKHDIL